MLNIPETWKSEIKKILTPLDLKLVKPQPKRSWTHKEKDLKIYLRLRNLRFRNLRPKSPILRTPLIPKNLGN